MMRKESAGDYQIGIYAVVRDPLPATRTGAVPPWRATTEFGYERRFRTLADAYRQLTGEPLRQKRKNEVLIRDARAAVDQFDALAKMERGGRDGETPLTCLDQPMVELIEDIDWQGVADLFRQLIDVTPTDTSKGG